jgi:hypothetical protein
MRVIKKMTQKGAKNTFSKKLIRETQKRFKNHTEERKLYANNISLINVLFRFFI